jgi:predicted nucleic acid-binding Zn ribbon protein
MKYCPTCGDANPDYAHFCTKCGHEIPSTAAVPPPPAPNRVSLPAEPMPETYLWQSIVVTILCCLFLGIPAIVYATQVEKHYLRGDMVSANRASNNAKNFCIWSLVLSLIGIGVWLIYVFVLGGLALGSI